MTPRWRVSSNIRGLFNVGWMSFTFASAAYKVRMRKLIPIQPAD
jgi:hypothetical protein